VYFFVHAEDCGGCSAATDRLYFRAYAADGTTLFLISGDTANPLNVTPITISAGDLKIGTSCCDQGEGDKDHGDKDKGKGDKGKGKDCGNKDNGGKDKGKGNGDKGGNGKDKGGKDCKASDKKK
jgi:hypothetical protein